MQIGIVGLPNVGKSTFFNALTRAGAGAENYPFCTIDPNIGVVTVPDKRLDDIYKIYGSKDKTPTSIEFVDIAGLVKGASMGEGLGNQFLAHIREVDAIAQVVRCFSDTDVPHVDGSIDPVRDIEIINTELIMADLTTIENRMEKTQKAAKSGEKEYLLELEELNSLKNTLEKGKNIRQLDLDKKKEHLCRELNLLSAKPIIYIANVDEDYMDFDNELVKEVRDHVTVDRAEVMTISARIEADIAELDSDEARLFLEDMGLNESGLDRVIRASYNLLDLITFFTGNEKEVRAWTITRGATAPEAAGRVHTDMQRGFIRAEVINYPDLMSAGSISQARDKGMLRLEGKDYIVKDGDICLFRFNV
ncbi:MAG: redox-regulated ATPase YchF [Halanaerobiales bacterium]